MAGAAMPPGTMTNTLHIALAPGKGLQAASALFRKYGDVASIKVLPTEETFGIKVVYFDVRDAARAHQGLTEPSRLAPQTGSRSVRMPGEAQLEVKDCEMISGVRHDEGCYILDFFDVRDATRVSAALVRCAEDGVSKVPRLPPVLEGFEATPGLTKGLPLPSAHGLPMPSPPGLKGIAHEAEQYPQHPNKATHRVLLTDVPSNILSQPMFRAVLQQAGLDSTVVGFTTSPGPTPEVKTAKRSKGGKGGHKQQDKTPSVLGSATVYFSSRHGAERCRHHFHGCSWLADDSSVIHASLEMVPTTDTTSQVERPTVAKVAALTLSAKAPIFEPISVPAGYVLSPATELPQTSADAPSCELAATTMDQSSEKQASTRLSPSAPEFRPMASAAAPPTGLNKQEVAAFKLRTASETSTDAGESSESLEDESRGLGVFASVGVKLGAGSLLAGLVAQQQPKSGPTPVAG